MLTIPEVKFLKSAQLEKVESKQRTNVTNREQLQKKSINWLCRH